MIVQNVFEHRHRALKPMNGWTISQRLKRLSNEVLQVSDGSLYPTLHKLEAALLPAKRTSRTSLLEALRHEQGWQQVLLDR